jgi:hypothetical protein
VVHELGLAALAVVGLAEGGDLDQGMALRGGERQA